jgi:glycosyltransferase involved in cell wall biosynthesis
VNVLHLSTYDVRGGAARAACRQHRALLEAGVNSQMLVRFKESDDDTVLRYEPPRSPWARVCRVGRRRWLRHAAGRARKAASNPAASLTDDRSDIAGAILDEVRPDVINVHFATGFLDFPSFFAHYGNSLPIVVTMHDMWPFTGGCHYAGGCDRYRRACGICPFLGVSREADLSREIWNRKSLAFTSVPKQRLVFVANSHWLAEDARSSSLLRDRRTEVIHYGLDTRVYRPGSRPSAKEALGIDPAETVILFGAAYAGDPRKGFRYLQEAVEGSRILQGCLCLSVGGGHVRFSPAIRHRHLGQVDSDVLLAAVYRAADVFVMPSLEEAFGQTALESIACGTPVAAFAAGGIPETVEDGVSGVLCPVGDVGSLRRAVEALVTDGALRQRLSGDCTSFIRSRFSYGLNAQRYVAIYEQLTTSRT